MWDKFLTFIRRGEADVESNGDRSDPMGDCCADDVVDDGTGRGFTPVFGVALAPVGVTCCECGRNRGLGGGCADS